MNTKTRVRATAVALAAASTVALAAPSTASAYSEPTRVHFGQRCTPGHSEGIPSNRTVIKLIGDHQFRCSYEVDKYVFWQLNRVSYFGLDKITKRCPGYPIQQWC
jgi:hypothetical protein